MEQKHCDPISDPRVERPVGDSTVHQVVAEVHVSLEAVEAPAAVEAPVEVEPAAEQQAEGM